MSSRTRNFRRRADDDDENDNESNGKETSSTATTKPSSKSTAISITTAAKAAKPKKPQTPKLLSFADDEDTETPSRQSSTAKFDKPSSRLSKPSSSSSHKITSIKDRIPPPSTSLPSNVQPQAGLYTKEALLELQKNTKTLASSRPTDRKPHSEPVIVLKGLVKPVDTLKEVEKLDEEEEGRGKGRSIYMRDRDDAETQLASLEIGKKSTEESGSLIPDQATINAIRAKRERLRQSRAAAPDYISLDGGSNHGEAEGLSDEEPEFQGRIAMFGEKIESGKKGVFEDFDERGIDTSSRKDDDTEDDVEEKIWEEEQFRKGLGKRMDNGSNIMITSSSNAPVVHSVQQQKYVYPAAAVYTPAPSVPPPPSIGGAFGASQGLDVMPISQQAEVARKALKENVNRLKESHGRTLSSLTRTEENLSSSLLNITSLEKSLSAAGEKFIFMQKLRDFVSVICDFLQHKAPFIEELEEQMQKLHEERASAVLERRVADNDDEMMEIEAAVNAARSILREGGSSAAMIAAATSAAQAAAAAVREEANLPVKLDEFGRDMNLQNRMDMERRAEARKRRKARSDSMRMSSMETDSSYQKIEGESSTDESDSESTAYQSNCESLLQTADQIFSDAAEEFSQLPLVKAWFEKWKKDYSSSYRDAYMSLSVPAIFGPYVRLELLKWDPLHVELDFYNMKWHSLLFDYGSNENGFSPDDADANLVPELVEKVALPILHHEIAHCWDMLSTKETTNAVAATSLLATYIPASSEAFGELLVAIRTRLADAVANVAVPTWSPLVMKAVPNAARVAAYRFGVCVRLMKNVCLWKEILSMPVLEKLALDELLSPKILPHLRSITPNVHDAVTRTERIIASMSGVWAGSSVTGGCSHKLQSLVDYVLLLGKTLEKKQASGVSESETSGLARRLKKMLVELNEYDEARAISRIFRLKEAL